MQRLRAKGVISFYTCTKCAQPRPIEKSVFCVLNHVLFAPRGYKCAAKLQTAGVQYSEVVLLKNDNVQASPAARAKAAEEYSKTTRMALEYQREKASVVLRQKEVAK